MKCILKLFLFLSIIIQSLLATQIKDKSSVFLTKKELSFLSKHKEIILGTDKGWKPYVIYKNKDNIRGYDKEVLNMINNLTGANFTLKAGSWKEMQEDAKSKKIDGLSTGTAHEKRKSYLNFSKPYISMHKMVITQKGNDEIKNLSDLDGKIIAIHESNLVDEKLASRFKTSKILKVDSVDKLLHSVATGKADAMFGNGATLYLANHLGILNLNLTIPLYEKMDLVFGIRKDWPEAISIVDKALNHIGEQKLLELKSKWFLLNLKQTSQNIITFTSNEKNYLKEKNSIKMCVSPNTLPYEKIDDKGKHKGIASDIMQIISKKIEKTIVLVPTQTWSESLENIKNKKCDILPIASSTPSRQNYMNFTEPYIKDSIVIVTKNDKFFINDSKDLSNRTIGVVEGYSFTELLKIKNPDIKVVSVKNANEGLEQVQDGKLFGYVDALPIIAHNIQKDGIVDLKVAGKLEFDLELSIASRIDEPELTSIMQKALKKIEEEQIRAIKDKWFAIKVEKSFDYRMLIYISIFFLLVLSVLIQRNRAIRKMNKKLEELSITDNLTKLYNRNKIDEVLAYESNRFNRFSSNFGIIIIDIDYFKEINDKYGHQLGDTVLKEFANILKSNSRKTDTIGRWGGEEFMIICAETNLDGILYLAKTLKEKISSYPFSVGEQRTASFGVSVYKKDESVDDMIKRADDALYTAKNNGRNQIEYL